MGTIMGRAVISGENSRETGKNAALKAISNLKGRLSLTIIFASPKYNYKEVLKGVREVTGDSPLIGCSSAGEFSDEIATSGSVGVSIISSDSMEINIGIGRELKRDINSAVKKSIVNFTGNSKDSMNKGYLGRTIFLVADGLAGGAEDLITELITQTGMQYQLFGGAAGDDGNFKETFVFYKDEVVNNAFVCAEILSEKPLPIGISHGWEPAGRPMRVTSSTGQVVHELNDVPAWDVYKRFSEDIGFSIKEDKEIAFMMDYPLGINCSPDEFKLRVPLCKQSDGSMMCAAEVPEGSLVNIMKADSSAIINSGGKAISIAKKHLKNEPIAGAFVFECIATRIKLGDSFTKEIDSMKDSLGVSPLLGCNSYGQLARVKGEFTGLMDATALVCLIPK